MWDISISTHHHWQHGRTAVTVYAANTKNPSDKHFLLLGETVELPEGFESSVWDILSAVYARLAATHPGRPGSSSQSTGGGSSCPASEPSPPSADAP